MRVPNLALMAFLLRLRLRYQLGDVVFIGSVGGFFCFVLWLIGTGELTLSGGGQSVVTILFSLLAVQSARGVRSLNRRLAARAFPILDNWETPQRTIASAYRMPPRPRFVEPALILGERHPVVVAEDDGPVLVQQTKEAFSFTPEYSFLPALGLATGLGIFGAPGSGKTASAIRACAFKLFHFSNLDDSRDSAEDSSRVGGLVMDSKGVLVQPLSEEMAAAGREADLIAIGPQRPMKWNPLHIPEARPSTIAAMFITAIENMNGSPYGAESRWIRNGATHFAEAIIGLIRLKCGYVTPLMVREFISALQSETQGVDQPSVVTRGIIDAYFSGSDIPETEPNEFAHHASLLVSRMSEDEKFRTIYLSELGNILVTLTEPVICDVCNSPKDELNFPSWKEAINRGLVVVLDCNSQEAPGLSIVLGTLLKLSYQQAMLNRPLWSADGSCNADRYMTLIIDEYQDFASHGDAEYLAKGRESKSLTIFSTQGIGSIIQKVGDEITTVILQSMRSRLFLAQSPPEKAAELLGKFNRQIMNTTYAEQVQDASLHATGKFAGKSTVAESHSTQLYNDYIVRPEDLASLPAFQGILQAFDGNVTIPTHRVFITPYFSPYERFADFAHWSEEQRAAKE